MTCAFQYFHTQLKSLFKNGEYSDATIHVIEVNSILQLSITGDKSTKMKKHQRKLKGKGYNNLLKKKLKENILYSLPVHRNILALQSDYFKNIFSSSMEESTTKVITLYVDKGDGIYLEFFIQSFYDHEVLEKLSAYELLRVMKIADMYCCNVTIQKIEDLLLSIKIQGLDECERIALYLKRKNFGLVKVTKCSENLLNQCAVYAAEMFYPLERNLKMLLEICETLSFELLMAILKCCKRLAWQENTILFYVCLWFEFDGSRQTSTNINLIFEEISVIDLTAEFLYVFIKEKASVFKNWSNFHKWSSFAIGYHAVSSKFQKSKNLKICGDDKEVKSYTCRMIKSEVGGYVLEQKFLIFEGYQICPKIIFLQNFFSESSFKIHFSMKITNLDKLFKDHKRPAIKFTMALVLYSEGKNNENYLQFKNIPKGSSCSVDIDYPNDRDCFTEIGTIRKECVSDINSFNIAIAFKEDGKCWPTSFPSHLKNKYSTTLNYEHGF